MPNHLSALKPEQLQAASGNALCMGKEPSLRGSACARHVTEWYSDRGILPLICHPERSKGSGCTIWSVIASEAPVPAILRTGTAICLFICHPECSEGSIFGFPIPQHPPQPHPNGTACVGMSPSTRHKLHPHRQAITRCARVEVSLKPEQLQVASSNALHKGAVRTSRHALCEGKAQQCAIACRLKTRSNIANFAPFRMCCFT